MSPSIGILALSNIPDDPRVRRQGDLFHANGWIVSALGLPGSRAAPPAWMGEGGTDAQGPATEHWEQERLPVGRKPRWRAKVRKTPVLGTTAIWAYRGIVAGRRLGDGLMARVRPSYAVSRFWTLNRTFADIYGAARLVRPNLWLANDWTTIPIAARLAAEQGVPFVYDTHELAADEYAQQWRWRLLHRPTIRAIEGECIRRAAFVTCVSDSIADRLQDLYALEQRPTVVRNTPQYSKVPFRRTGRTIEVLYHGIVSTGRGLEECIRSVPLWRSEFRLTIRGPASEGYRDLLAREIAKAGVGDRVRLAPPVPMVDLVREAAPFDVGLFVLPGHSLHNTYALPNKFFEYTMAGLALCVSDLPEMARLLKRHDLGVLIAGLSPEGIAAAINGLDPTAIDIYKQRSLAVARELNWEREGAKLLERCSALLTS